jgi:hypothetical protein
MSLVKDQAARVAHDFATIDNDDDNIVITFRTGLILNQLVGS